MTTTRECIKEGIKAGLLWLWANGNNSQTEKDLNEIIREAEQIKKIRPGLANRIETDKK